MKLNVMPVYGNGWTDGTVAVEQPLPFEISVTKQSHKETTGTVSMADHHLDGYSFEASPRHSPATGYFTCMLTSPSPDLSPNKIYGYCKLGATLSSD